MGICASAPADPAASGKTASINTALAKEQYASEQEIKVLFLGTLPSLPQRGCDKAAKVLGGGTRGLGVRGGKALTMLHLRGCCCWLPPSEFDT